MRSWRTMRRACGADGGSDGELLLAGGAASEEKNRDVATADQQQQRDGGEKQIERAADVVDEVFVESAGRGA